jgi:tetratricopeptide (TPR) repeat protein
VNSQSDQNTLELVKKALLQNDLARAAAILQNFHDAGLIDNPEINELYHTITQTYSALERIQSLSQAGARALDNGDGERALELFSQVLELSPDHEKARAGLQGAKKYCEWRENVARALHEAHQARAAGDYDTAREKCMEVLRLAPNNDVAQDFLVELNHWVDKRKQAWQLVQMGKRLFSEKKYSEAIQVWESITGIDQSFSEGIELIESAKIEIEKSDRETRAATLLRDAQRAYDIGRYAAVLDIMKDFPDSTSLSIDSALLMRKTKDALDTRALGEDLEKKINALLQAGNTEEARKMYVLLLQVAPQSKLIDELRIIFR